MLKTFKKFIILFFPVIMLVIIGGLLLTERLDISYAVSEDYFTYLPASTIDEKDAYKEVEKDVLVLTDSTQENNGVFSKHVKEVLNDMRVGYNVVDLSKAQVPDFKPYTNVIIVFQNLNILADKAISLCDWVEKDGGGVMLFCTPDISSVYRYMSSKLGVEEGPSAYAIIKGMTLADGFMIGSDGFTFHWGDPMATALSVRLNDKAKVYATSDDESKIPLIWSADYGKGRFVVMNHGMTEKTTRGLTASAYSLLQDVCVYPVINASSFFLDDFPSPVPMGDAQYIRKYFNRDIASFYSNVWWPDMIEIAEKHGVRYTGVVIEDYTDQVSPPFNATVDRERFNYFGAMLLDHGGEIGIHGYNHMPLCFSNFDYKDELYKPWDTEDGMIEALNKVVDFTEETFPGSKVACYVPPSNILSPEGKRILAKNFPQIKTINSVYMHQEGDVTYSQEFEIDKETGIIEFPRVISGAELDQYMYWAAINTLNLYYVNSHFIHPDDSLDEDRGAAMGWDAMRKNLEKYMDWLYDSAPNIRNFTATDSAKATQRYDVLSFERTDHEKSVDLRLFGFWDEASFMVRINNKGTPSKVEGGSIERIDGDHYLLTATSANVTISFEE